jgi:hypothetical protein
MSEGKEQLVRTLEVLAGEAAAGEASEWENTTLARYLDALAAWISVYERAYTNTGRPVPEDPWEIMAAAVRAATIYE